MPGTDGPLATRAVALAREVRAGSKDQPTAVRELASAIGPQDQRLVSARDELLQRVHLASDDFQATAALALVNKALAQAGWQDPYSWKHRRKP